MTKTAAIFPGQGAQLVGMGKDVAEASERGRAVFAQANEILGYDLTTLCFEGPAAEIERTDIQQPAIFVTSIALWEAYLEAGGRIEAFSCAGGLSLGEYTALHVAGALTFADALRLVHRRGTLMQQAAVAAPSGMVSLLGADEEKARNICEAAAQGAILVPANFNCPGQVVLSGDKEACGRAAELASEHGCRAAVLPVAGAFHSPFMKPAAEELGVALRETEFAKPQIPVVSNVHADYHTEPDAMRNFLQRQLTEPVLWQKDIERMISDGVGRFVEFGPGRVLTGLMRKIDRKMPTVNVSTMALVGEAVEATAS
jgi:[acyl-carrier-protein] S-malonyltransferase